MACIGAACIRNFQLNFDHKHSDKTFYMNLYWKSWNILQIMVCIEFPLQLHCKLNEITDFQELKHINKTKSTNHHQKMRAGPRYTNRKERIFFGELFLQQMKWNKWKPNTKTVNIYSMKICVFLKKKKK